MVLRLRSQLIKYFSTRRYVLSVIDFAEKFGANMNQAERALRESDQDRKAVVSFYVNGDYQESLEKLTGALTNLDKVSQLALDAKNQALVWIYVIEWLTVSGTAMFCGAILWTLMVKRSVYREVGLTRFQNL
jgi:hypothetical protein